ncbi:MAG TPA: hypothetical protein VJ793_01870 [Anaerolineae bacterium]|nr:hypothetical protein [Pyrinomonadaceae bacterium]HKZ82385.1 hypothetical protein [Anaerolineae bacterium]
MTKTLHLKLTDEAEKLLAQLGQVGVSEQDAIAQALSLLKMAVDTERVAILKPNANPKIVDLVIEHILVAGRTESAERDTQEPATEPGIAPEDVSNLLVAFSLLTGHREGESSEVRTTLEKIEEALEAHHKATEVREARINE